MQKAKHKPGVIELIERQAKARGLPSLAIVDEKATITNGNEAFYRVWLELSTTRKFAGMNGTPLPLNILDICAYCSEFGFMGFYRDFLIDLILKVDLEVMKENGTSHKPTKSSPPNGKNRHPH